MPEAAPPAAVVVAAAGMAVAPDECESGTGIDGGSTSLASPNAEEEKRLDAERVGVPTGDDGIEERTAAKAEVVVDELRQSVDDEVGDEAAVEYIERFPGERDPGSRFFLTRVKRVGGVGRGEWPKSAKVVGRTGDAMNAPGRAERSGVPVI